jgi:glucokinase
MDEQQPAEPPQGVVVGVDVGGTKTALMVTDVETGEDLGHDRYPTPADIGPTKMIEEIGAAVSRLISTAGRDPATLRAVGVAMPGMVDAEHGRVVLAGNLSGWRDIPLRDVLSRSMGVPVFVENDAKAAALGEQWRGCARQMHNFVFLALGTGIGAGVVVNGRLHHGYHNASGEVGNFIMGRKHLGKDRDGHGDLELLIGGPAIREEAEETAGEPLSVRDAFEEAEEDKRLAKLADRVADYLAMAVINIAVLLDPEAVIFGGGTATAGEPLLDRVRERIDRELLYPPALMLSALGEEAQLHGAVFGALWQLNPSLALREELR